MADNPPAGKQSEGQQAIDALFKTFRKEVEADPDRELLGLCIFNLHDNVKEVLRAVEGNEDR